tara:strand:+ start:264 stop:596 length:333 start_codon:yes stop_codon:yes gene_type:complete
MRIAGKAVFIVSRRYILGFMVLKLIDFAGCARVSNNLILQKIKNWGSAGPWLRGVQVFAGRLFCALRNSSFFVNDGNYVISARRGLIRLWLAIGIEHAKFEATKFRIRSD